MSLLDFFKKKPIEVNQKMQDTIQHYLNNTKLESAQKAAIIYLVQSVSTIKLRKQEGKNKQLHFEFISNIIALSGISVEDFLYHSAKFKDDEKYLNWVLQNLSVKQKVVFVILLNLLITFCQFHKDDWSHYHDTLSQVYKMLDTEVDLFELAIAELKKYNS
jgi:hypothetical protein